MGIAVEMAFGLHLHEVFAGSVGEIDVEIVDGGFLVDCLHRHVVVDIERERVALRYIVALGVLPSNEVIAEILGSGEGNLCAFVEDRALRTDRNRSGLRRFAADVELV